MGPSVLIMDLGPFRWVCFGIDEDLLKTDKIAFEYFNTDLSTNVMKT